MLPGGVRPDDPGTLAKTTSLGYLIASARKPIHIVYVHGMRADGQGASESFRTALCRYVQGLAAGGTARAAPSPQPLPLPSPSSFPTYLGQPIWRSREEWQASMPFVLRFEYPRAGAPPIIVDEVNWWPLLFPAKCRFIVYPEIHLSGLDRAHIKLCACDQKPYYPWLSADERDAALAHKPTSGGGARANAYLKQQIMNWGMADAVLALGPLRTYCRQALDLAFDYASRGDAGGLTEQEFVVISESLGSFAVLDAFNNLFEDSRAAQRVGERAPDLYFFANQFALLELARIERPQESAAALAPGTSPVHLLRRWALSGPGVEATRRPKQVIAFSDPSDLLTYSVPKLKDPGGKDLALVVNVYDRNEWSWLRLFANPTMAHTAHARNRSVLRLMFSQAPPRP